MLGGVYSKLMRSSQPFHYITADDAACFEYNVIPLTTFPEECFCMCLCMQPTFPIMLGTSTCMKTYTCDNVYAIFGALAFLISHVPYIHSAYEFGI